MQGTVIARICARARLDMTIPTSPESLDQFKEYELYNYNILARYIISHGDFVIIITA